MRFFEVVLSGAALIAAAFAVEFNDVPTSIEAGKTYTITYSPKDNTPTTLKLRQGDPNNLSTLQTITTTATGGSFQWTVPNSLPNAKNYALEIVQGTGTPNYSGLIPLTGSTVSSSASTSASSTSASSSSTSASKTSSSSSATTTGSSSSTLTTAASASISGAPTSSGNSTLSSTSRTPTASNGASQSSGNSAPPQSTSNGAGMLSSPIALVLCAVAAMAYLN